MIHVLIVDDQALNRILLSKMLEQEGYKISVAYNGLDALNVLKREQIDIVLLDVLMPVMDGFEAAEKIKQQYTLFINHLKKLFCMQKLKHIAAPES